MNGHFSEWLPVLSGVPQGGPLLFILYINDLHAVVKSSFLKIYADDVKIVYIKLQNDLNCVHACSLLWQLTLSPSKCEALNVTNKHSPVSFDYTIGSSPVARKQKVKYLGVIISNGMVTVSRLYTKRLNL